MRQIGRFEFPESFSDAKSWQPYVQYKALHRQVLVVATTRIEGAWKAYCGTVPGRRHDDEYLSVLAEGCKVPEVVARALFPEFEGVKYAR